MGFVSIPGDLRHRKDQMSLYRQVVGIDVGRHGAVAAIGIRTGLPRCWDMPDERDRGTDLDGLDDILSQVSPVDSLVFLEYNTGMPGEVPDFAFRFGLQTGQIDGVLHAKGYTVRHVAPNRWKGTLGLPGKSHEDAIKICAAFYDEKFPAFPGLIRGPRGGILDGRLDSLLIAWYGYIGEVSPCGHRGGKRPIRRTL